jgi:hypothetical protein
MMTLKTIILIWLTFLPFFSVGQTISYKKMTKSEVFIYEYENGGVIKDSSKRFRIMENPISDIYPTVKTDLYIFKRNNDDFDPSLHVWYFFDRKSKELIGKRYYWGFYNLSFNPSIERDRLTKLTEKEGEFAKKFKNLRIEINETIGKQFKSEIIENNQNVYIQKVYWVDNEKYINLNIIFFRSIPFDPNVVFLGNFEIEVMITYK